MIKFFKKTGVVGIDLTQARNSKNLDLLKNSGNNSGNLLFTYSVSTHLSNCLSIGFSLENKIDLINNEFDSLVFPAANWIDITSDWGFIIHSLEKINIPICCVGLGSQNTLNDIKKLPQGTIRFLEILAAKSKLIGVRGKWTRQILEYFGIKNTDVIGCPALFPNLQEIRNLNLNYSQSECRISMSFTRYKRDDPDPDFCQQRLAILSAKFSSSIVLQGEEAEICYLEKPDAEIAAWLCSYYNIDENELPRLVSKLQFFNSQESWVQFHRDNTDFTISSRIHGCVASLLAGKPALLLAHDQRTSELAETMGIPQRPIECVHTVQTKEDLLNLIRDLDYTDFFAKQITNLEKLKHLYKTCGVAIRGF